MEHKPDWFLNITTEGRPARAPDKSLAISKVARASPAEELRLAPGDTFVSINGTPALEADLPDMLIGSEKAIYVFIRQADDSQITVETPALPMGIRTRVSVDDIVASYRTCLLYTSPSPRDS